jgi:hypothetical protein
MLTKDADGYFTFRDDGRTISERMVDRVIPPSMLKQCPKCNLMQADIANCKGCETTNPKDIVGRTKPPLDLVLSPALVQLAMVMKLGAEKYGKANWRTKEISSSVYIAAAMRHLMAHSDGEDSDPESGQSHLAHCMACCFIMLDAQSIGKLVDDRPTPGGSAQAIRKFTEKE